MYLCWITRCFHGTFATGVACQQGTLTLPETCSVPLFSCICFYFETIFTESVVMFLSLRNPLGIFYFDICLSIPAPYQNLISLYIFICNIIIFLYNFTLYSYLKISVTNYYVSVVLIKLCSHEHGRSICCWRLVGAVLVLMPWMEWLPGQSARSSSSSCSGTRSPSIGFAVLDVIFEGLIDQQSVTKDSTRPSFFEHAS